MIDGPFAEAKELIAGFAILDVGRLDEAVEHARKFALLVEATASTCARSSRWRTSSSPSSSDPAVTAEVDRRVAALWRVESPRVTARLARLVGDLDTAEELAQDAFVAALERWRRDGIPDNPAAWLTKTARDLAVDRLRRRDTGRAKYQVVAASTPLTVEHRPRRGGRR